MKLNKDWHLAHPMPRHPTLDQKLDWHMQHAENCSCREMPESIRRELAARGWTQPSLRSLK